MKYLYPKQISELNGWRPTEFESIYYKHDTAKCLNGRARDRLTMYFQLHFQDSII